ncbi:unnamed protein product [Schistosoma mattheei]|uniref:Uncharacterized protein n=1 Tax=Schistosoma mattheei TaxID=31246 RepID=A0A183P6J8_9TREM|nr:unnamed protein product [Schistosoma mattheei]
MPYAQIIHINVDQSPKWNRTTAYHDQRLPLDLFDVNCYIQSFENPELRLQAPYELHKIK